MGIHWESMRIEWDMKPSFYDVDVFKKTGSVYPNMIFKWGKWWQTKKCATEINRFVWTYLGLFGWVVLSTEKHPKTSSLFEAGELVHFSQNLLTIGYSKISSRSFASTKRNGHLAGSLFSLPNCETPDPEWLDQNPGNRLLPQECAEHVHWGGKKRLSMLGLLFFDFYDL